MTTQAQIEANRLNAQKSTGPKTDSGKAVIAQNALKHGLTATALIYGEEKSDYDSFSEAFLEELAPVGPTETHLAERIIALAWRLHRADRFQSAAIDHLTDKAVYNETKHPRLNDRNELENPRGSILGDIVFKAFTSSCILDRLLLYERRIETSLTKSRLQFRQLQTERKAKENETESVQSAF